MYLHFGNARDDANFTGLTGTWVDGPGEHSIQIGASLLSPGAVISPI